jgi:hypothetical protein
MFRQRIHPAVVVVAVAMLAAPSRPRAQAAFPADLATKIDAAVNDVMAKTAVQSASVGGCG